MRLLLPLFTLTLVLLSSVTAASILVQYPKEAFIGSKISINFALIQQEINSTAFPFITPGTREISTSPLILEGIPIGGAFAVFHVQNFSNEITITFKGKVNTPIYWNPGIVVYGGNFNPHISDLRQNNFTSVLLTFTGNLVVHNDTGWIFLSTSLPKVGPQNGIWINTTYPFNYTVILSNVNGDIYVNCIFINGSKYVVNYQTYVPWNFSYIGVMTDNLDVVTICDFYASNVTVTLPHQPYVVYVNDKEYATGYTNSLGEGSVTLTVSSPSMIVNITFPSAHVFHVITISAQKDANIHAEYPILQYVVLGVSALLVVISSIIERRKR
ncbi:hypothetical protein [Stygiolobus azoricus]|uniref:Uncharacterized protein n=1 Tax=Stygiolobus azoricus TaxID=41675 RepID=A0A650CQK7_9CREN|nr:hypothetical protein [Stygiolobus azoricus]QGR19757.1 hypothetical protein D1868_06970 [Stygiolobus azoricus]